MNDIEDKVNLRGLILDDIARIREREHNFDKGTMRWRSLWFKNGEGLVRVRSKKERVAMQPIIHLSETNTNDFALLSDSELLESYKNLIIIQIRQM